MQVMGVIKSHQIIQRSKCSMLAAANAIYGHALTNKTEVALSRTPSMSSLKKSLKFGGCSTVVQGRDDQQNIVKGVYHTKDVYKQCSLL